MSTSSPAAVLVLLSLSAPVAAGCGSSSPARESGNGAVLSVVVTPNPASTTAGGSIPFQSTVIGAKPDQSTAVTWSVSSAGGTIAASGLYVASSNPGTYSVVATSVSDTTKSGTAAVTVLSVPASSLDQLRALSSKRIYFQHASVGGESVGVYDPGGFTGNWGLLRILADNPGSGTKLARDANTAAAIPAGTIGEWTHGASNGDPDAKLSLFDSRIRGGLGGAMSFALFKLGYPDFDQTGNVNTAAGLVPVGTWFTNTYQPKMDALQAAYPATAIIHVTAPLHSTCCNRAIQAWNDLLRASYPGKTFDLAVWQTVDAGSTQGAVCQDGTPCVNPRWVRPGDDHVNQAGADWLGNRLLEFLANLAG
jgi:hypothetical protein